MPWTNVTSGEEINRCVILARCGRFTVTELCEQFGISRETGYKHLERCAALVWRACSRAATGRTTRRSAPTKRSRHSFSRSAGQGELWFTDEDAQPAAAASEPVFWTEPTRPDDQSHPPAAADPTDRAADTSQASSRLTPCQPTHTSQPEKTLKTLF